MRHEEDDFTLIDINPWHWLMKIIFCRKGHDYVKPPGSKILKCRFCDKEK